MRKPIDQEEASEQQVEKDIKLVLGPLSCTPGFLERRNAALDRIKASCPEEAAAWEYLFRWDGRSVSNKPREFTGELIWPPKG